MCFPKLYQHILNNKKRRYYPSTSCFCHSRLVKVPTEPSHHLTQIDASQRQFPMSLSKWKLTTSASVGGGIIASGIRRYQIQRLVIKSFCRMSIINVPTNGEANKGNTSSFYYYGNFLCFHYSLRQGKVRQRNHVINSTVREQLACV